MKRRVEVTMSVTRAMLLREGLKVEKKKCGRILTA